MPILTATSLDPIARRRVRLDVTGRVQGVGFRPFIHRLATEERLSGFVCNTESGATVEIEGTPASIDRFMGRLEVELLPPAKIESRSYRELTPFGPSDFIIRQSRSGAAGSATVLPDLVTCAQCAAEMFDPDDRRYRYPFTTCVHCGPRFSIIESIPYDRERTSMRRFSMCSACRAEYDDPTSRRFHSETNCCPACGPTLTLLNAAGERLAGKAAALDAVVTAVRGGMVVAVLGLGGFQLIADARNEAAVTALRQRKMRPTKPFALMVPGLDAARELAEITPAEAELLTSAAGPIVLVRAKPAIPIASSVAPGNPLLGLMLPTTPLHHLLLRALDFPVVATSGNRGSEPIVADADTAPSRLAGLADLFLVHDRPIVRPIDDSVVRIIAGDPTVLRLARGLAPAVISFPQSSSPSLALGGHQKSAVALHLGGQIVLGPHIGDLDTQSARDVLDHTATALPNLYRLKPHRVASDSHPDYYTTRLASRLASSPVRVPHHLAHVLSGMAENGLTGPVLGIAWDGTGFGSDRTIWGGEAIAVRADHWRRLGNLLPFRLPGGAAAVRQPWRSAMGALFAIGGEAAIAESGVAETAGLSSSDEHTVRAALGHAVNAPLTSSAGRLFDATAALLGLKYTVSYEGEGASALEFAAGEADEAYPVAPISTVVSEGNRMILDWRPTLSSLVEAFRSGATTASLALGFHLALADAISTVARHAGIADVLLTGGCFQNARLAEAARDKLIANGFTVHLHRQIPPNDGGLAVGQAVFAAHPLSAETS